MGTGIAGTGSSGAPPDLQQQFQAGIQIQQTSGSVSTAFQNYETFINLYGNQTM